jgi:hypothetical protein
MSGKYPGGFVQVGAPAGYSVYFDGTGDQLTIPSSSAFAVGTTFTFECWIYPLTSGGVNGQPFFVNTTSAEIQVGYQSSTAWGVAANGVVWRLTTTTMPTLNAWNHIVVTRSGLGTNQTSLFLNGVRVANGTVADVWTSAGAANIGLAGSGTYTGYISNLRLVKGTAVYDPTQTTINVPTQLFPIANTSLLTCQSPNIIDNSSNAFTITANGDARVSTFTPFVGYTAGASGFRPALGAAAPGVWTLEEATYYQGNRLWPIYDPNFNQTTLMLHGNSPTNLPTWITDASTNNFALTVFADAKASSQTPFSLTTYPTSGSGFFDGTGDYLLTPSNAAFNPSGSDITVDFFVYLTRYAVTNNIIFEVGTSAVGDMQCNITNTGAVRFTVGGSTGSTISGFTLNTWHYVSCVKSGTNFTVYLNGTAGTTVSLTANSKTQMYIGAQSGGNNIDGYISNFRFVKGSANVPSGVPTAPLTAVANTSLLTLQNAQPTANSSFADSSTNNFPITRFGNTTQGTFTPFSQTGWSNYFNGSSNLSAASGPTLSGDFTLEAFVYVTTLNANNMVFGTSSSDNYFGVNTAGLAADFGANPIRWNFTWQTNTWYHIAISRASNTVRAFVNGAQLTLTSGTATDSSTYFSGNILVGRYRFSSALYFTGYISNARVVSGGAIYTGSYTVPTSNLGTTVSAGTVALLTCQSNRFVDNSASPLVVTVANGTPSVQTFSPFPPLTAYTALNVGGSDYSAATGDYLTIPYSTTNFDWFTSGTDYTIEAWIMVTAAGWQSGGQPSTIGNMTPASTTNYWSFGVNASLQPTFYYFNGSTVTVTFTGVTGTFNQWMHLAMCKTSSGIQLFANGVGGTVTAISGTPQSSTGTTLTIGQNNSVACPGYISGVRIVKGTALYSGSTYTIPTAPPTAVTNTKLLCNFTNAGIIDSTSDNVLQTVGTAQISTVQSKYGGSSMVFNGTNSNLQLPSTPTFAMGGGDWTVEMWLYPNNVATLQGLLSFGVGAWRFFLNNSGLWFLNGASSIVQTAQSIVTTGQWYHVAVCRSGSSVRIFLNGTQIGSTGTDTSTYAAGIAYVGSEAAGSYLNGYIDDLRVTRGIARYTTTFTPPTSQLQNQ